MTNASTNTRKPATLGATVAHAVHDAFEAATGPAALFRLVQRVVALGVSADGGGTLAKVAFPALAVLVTQAVYEAHLAVGESATFTSFRSEFLSRLNAHLRAYASLVCIPVPDERVESVAAAFTNAFAASH